MTKLVNVTGLKTISETMLEIARCPTKGLMVRIHLLHQNKIQ